jgi:hypothetical protein
MLVGMGKDRAWHLAAVGLLIRLVRAKEGTTFDTTGYRENDTNEGNEQEQRGSVPAPESDSGNLYVRSWAVLGK